MQKSHVNYVRYRLRYFEIYLGRRREARDISNILFEGCSGAGK